MDVEWPFGIPLMRINPAPKYVRIPLRRRWYEPIDDFTLEEFEEWLDVSVPYWGLIQRIRKASGRND